MTGFQRGPDGVEAGNVIAETIALVSGGAGGLGFEAGEDLGTHVGHDAHVDHHVGAVGDFHADLGEWGIERTHAEGDHIHGAALHAADEFSHQLGAHFGGIGPVVGGACAGRGLGADEGPVFDAGDVRWGRTGKKAVRALFRIEAGESAFFNHQGSEAVPFGSGAIAPLNRVGHTKGGDFCDPFLQGGVGSLRSAHNAGN